MAVKSIEVVIFLRTPTCAASKWHNSLCPLPFGIYSEDRNILQLVFIKGISLLFSFLKLIPKFSRAVVSYNRLRLPYWGKQRPNITIIEKVVSRLLIEILLSTMNVRFIVLWLLGLLSQTMASPFFADLDVPDLLVWSLSILKIKHIWLHVKASIVLYEIVRISDLFGESIS